jgi:hypothetical protein
MLKFGESFELVSRSFIRDYPVENLNLASCDEVGSYPVPSPDRTSQKPRNVSGIVRQVAALHVDQVQNEPVCALEFQRHPDRALQKITRKGPIVREPVLHYRCPP